MNAHPVQVTLPGPGGRHQTVTITALAVLSFVEGYLGEAQIAVQLPAILHALALDQWSQVIARLGATTADLTPPAPTALPTRQVAWTDVGLRQDPSSGQAATAA